MSRGGLGVVVVLVAVVAASSPVLVAPAAGAAQPDVAVVGEPPGTVAPGGTVSITYEVTNAGTDPASFDLRTPDLPPGVSVAQFGGDVRVADPDATPPSASTTGVSAGGSATVTVTYALDDSETAGTVELGVLAVSPVDGTSDGARTRVDVGTGDAGPVVDLAPGDLAGNGTGAAPYVVTNVSELRTVADDLDANYTLGADVDASSLSTAGIGSGFEPIGSFEGTLDGANHAITGLRVEGSDEVPTGLFGTIDESGVVRDLSVVDLTAEGVNGTEASDEPTGGVVAENDGLVANVTVDADVSGDGVVGGVAGVNRGAVRDVTATTDVTGGSGLGGVVGVNNGTLAGVRSTATVEANRSAESGAVSVAGGVAGTNRGRVVDVFATTRVTGQTRVGGVVGEAPIGSGPVRNVSVSATVSGEEDVGGVVGRHEVTVTARDVSATVEVTGERNVGGVAGYSRGWIGGAFATGTVDGTRAVGGITGVQNSLGRGVRNSSADVAVTGTSRVGGAVGENRGTVADTFATGRVSGDRAVGGLVGAAVNGEFRESTVVDSYWDVDATGQSTSNGSGVGLATAAMTGESARTAMDGLEFTTLWRTVPGGYPALIPPGNRSQPEFAVGVESISDPVTAGDRLAVTATVENRGGATRTQTVELLVAGARSDPAAGGRVDATSVTLAPGASTTTTLSTVTDSEAVPGVTLAVRSETDSLTRRVRVRPATDTPLRVDIDPEDLPGDGTESAPYVLDSLPDLQAMEDDLDAVYTLGGDIDATEASRTNTSVGFDPIGGSPDAGPFTGRLYGAGHTVAGLYVDRPTESEVGLFGRISEGAGGGDTVVRNLRLRNATVRGDREVGGIVGVAAGGLRGIEVDGVDVRGEQGVGGVAGRLLSDSGGNGSVRAASVSGTVEAGNDVGGLVGLTDSGAGGVIGNVSADVRVEGGANAGGLIGLTDSPYAVRDASASGRVTGDSRVGGLVGLHRLGTVVRASANGGVTGNESVGGLVGFNSRTRSSGPPPVVRRAVATGSVTGDESVGGLVGLNTGRVRDAAAAGTVTGGTGVGGLVGDNVGSVRDVLATGAVRADGFAGGVAGVGFGGTARDAYWDTRTTGRETTVGNGTGLTTDRLTGAAARGNASGLAFGTAWRTVPGDYPLPAGVPSVTGGDRSGSDLDEPAGFAPFEETAVLPEGRTDPDSLAGQVRVETGSLRDVSIAVGEATSRGYTLTVDTPPVAEPTTLYLRTRAISTTADVRDLELLVDGDGRPFEVTDPPGSTGGRFVVFDVPGFATREVSFVAPDSGGELTVSANLTRSVVYQGSPLRVDVTTAGADVSRVAVGIGGRTTAVSCSDVRACDRTVGLAPARSTWNGSGYAARPVTVTVETVAGETRESSVTTRVYAAGDVDGSGRVDVRDAASLGRRWRTTAGGPDYASRADVNGDGVVDIFDATVLARNFGDRATNTTAASP